MGKLTGRRRSRGCSTKKAQYYEEVIRLYHEEGLSGLEISRLIPVHNSNIYRWLDEYDLQNDEKTPSMREEKKKSVPPRPRRAVGVTAPEVRPTAMAEVKSEEAGVRESGDQSSLLNQLSLLKGRIEELEQQLASKDNELRDKHLEAELYKEIIAVAEEKFNVPIRKKAGAKQ